MDEKLNLILPGNPRYQPKSLKDSFGYDNLYYTLAQVEIATMEVLLEIGVIPEEEGYILNQEGLKEKLLAITTTKVDKTEKEITHHDVRAWILEAQKIINSALSRWVHVPLTSYDGLDTGRIMQFLKAYNQSLKPSIKEVVKILAGVTASFSGQIQIGRTHGQHALPITVGFWLATILARIVYNAQQMKIAAERMNGKISGAVGAHNAQYGLRFNQKCGNKNFEERILEKLALKPAKISTQILPPEPLAYFLFSASMLSASFGQFGRDCRNLMRSEIGEIAEEYERGQVGSSTMAHKRNPINFENMEGMWIKTKNEFGKVLDTLISEHQRDLVGSCVARDFPIILVNLQQQMDTLLRRNKSGVPFLSRITVNHEACKKNFEMSKDFILAEPLYIAMQMAGYDKDAHKLINEQAMAFAKEFGVSLPNALTLLANDHEDVKKALNNIPEELLALFHHPEQYIGDAKEKALEIANYAMAVI